MPITGRLQSGDTNDTQASPAPIAPKAGSSIGRLSSSGTPGQTPNNVPASGFLSGLKNVAENVTQDAWSGIKNAWSTFTYWEARPSQAIETTIAKVMGVPEAKDLNPLKVLVGSQKTNLSGSDIVTQIEKNMGKDTSSWQEKTGAFGLGLGLDIATDPFMYLEGAGLIGHVGDVADETGKVLGIVSDDGVNSLKDFSESSVDATRDLTKASPATIEAGKASLATRYAAGETNLLTERGIKFAGQTILSGDRIDKTIASVRGSALADWISNTRANSVFQSVFNPRWINGSEVPADFHDARLNLLSKNSVVTGGAVEAAMKELDTAGTNLTPKEAEDFFKIANDTKGELGLGSDALKDLSREDLMKYLPKDVTPNTADHLLSYWNNWRPMMEGIKGEAGLTDESKVADYMRNVGYEPETKVYTQSRPFKKLSAAFMKGRISDEDFLRGAMHAAGQDSDEIDKAIYDLKHPLNANEEGGLHDAAMKARYAYGLSTDPYLSLATEHAETMARKNTFDFINQTMAKYGEMVTPEQAKVLQKEGYGIYTPSSFFTNKNAQEVYAFKDKGIADTLNQIFTKTPDSDLVKSLRNTSGRLVNMYFLNPLTSVYHIVHNVGMNMFLAGGTNAFDNVSKGIEDARDGGGIIDMMREYGALKPQVDTRPMEEILKESMGNSDPQGVMRKLGDYLNPFGNTNVGNRIFSGSDEAVRASIFRNSLEKGASPKEAADFVNHVAGNWKDITPTEKSLFQLVYPYYSWFKTNVKLQFGVWLTNPQRQILPIKVWNMLNEAASGVPLWQNDTGAAWKIATGQRNAKGEQIYVTPAVSTNIVPELVQGGVQGLASRVLSGPIPEAGSLALTGKDVYSNLYGVSSPYADSGAPLLDRATNFVMKEISPQGADAVQQAQAKGAFNAMVQALTGWDSTHPMWENIIETFLQSYAGGVEPTWIQAYYQTEAAKKYKTDLAKYNKKAMSQ
jgi:hypothetical protein